MKNTSAMQTKISKSDLAAATVTNDASLWDSTEGETYGGDADILKLEVGQIAGPLSYEGRDQKGLEFDGEKVDVHVGRDNAGKRWRLPLSASFRNQLTESKLAEGDTFLVRRAEDAIKKKGKGRGNPMKIYQIKVTARAS